MFPWLNQSLNYAIYLNLENKIVPLLENFVVQTLKKNHTNTNLPHLLQANETTQGHEWLVRICQLVDLVKPQSGCQQTNQRG